MKARRLACQARGGGQTDPRKRRGEGVFSEAIDIKSFCVCFRPWNEAFVRRNPSNRRGMKQRVPREIRGNAVGKAFLARRLILSRFVCASDRGMNRATGESWRNVVVAGKKDIGEIRGNAAVAGRAAYRRIIPENHLSFDSIKALEPGALGALESVVRRGLDRRAH